MKKRAVSMILAAAMVCGMMAANVSCDQYLFLE